MENLALWPCLSTKVATEQGGTSAPTGEPALGAQGTALSAALGRNRYCLSPVSTLLPTKPCSHLYCTGGTMPSCTNRGSCHSSCLHRGLEHQPVTAHLTKQCTLVCAALLYDKSFQVSWFSVQLCAHNCYLSTGVLSSPLLLTSSS